MIKEIQIQREKGRFVGAETEYTLMIQRLNGAYKRMLKNAREYSQSGIRKPIKLDDIEKCRKAITFLTGNYYETDHEVLKFLVRYGREMIN